jgi:hypothetical protein
MATGISIEQASTAAFFSPRAFDGARLSGITHMEPNPEAIGRIGEITASVSPEFALPDAARSLLIVLRGGHPEVLPHRWDGRFLEAGITQGYVPLSGLESENPLSPPIMTKLEILRLGRPLLELSVHNFNQPFGPAMASTILGGFQRSNQVWASVATMFDTGHSPITNIRRIRAVQKVTKEGLEPFVIRRGPNTEVVRTER